MRHDSKQWEIETQITDGSNEYKDMISRGWFRYSIDGNGFITMARKKRVAMRTFCINSNSKNGRSLII